MPDDTPTDSQRQHIKRVINRWIIYDWAWVLFFTSVAAFALFLTVGSSRIGLVVFLIVAYFIPTFRFYSRFAARRFARRISREDRELMKRIVLASSDNIVVREAEKLIQAYHKVNPQAEYLRASQPTEGDTLLRAAAHTDNTPQDQLLRPSDGEEK